MKIKMKNGFVKEVTKEIADIYIKKGKATAIETKKESAKDTPKKSALDIKLEKLKKDK